jgi:hypothetical protein
MTKIGQFEYSNFVQAVLNMIQKKQTSEFGKVGIALAIIPWIPMLPAIFNISGFA